MNNLEISTEKLESIAKIQDQVFHNRSLRKIWGNLAKSIGGHLKPF